MSRLTLIRKSDRVDKKGHRVFGIYLCDCGNECEARIAQVNSGNTKSCGCLVKENGGKVTHGLRHHPLYEVWLNMKQRCTNPKKKEYKYYGGRGIKVCDRWQSFQNFFDDVSATYKPGLQLDRKIDFGNYEPGNVRWIPHKKNSQRRRYCKLNNLLAKKIRAEKGKSVSVLAAQFNVSRSAVWRVIKNLTWVR